MTTSDWATRTGLAARKSAMVRWGQGWALLSQDQRDAFIAYEVMGVLLAQDEEHAHEQVRRLQAVAQIALKGDK